MSLYQEQPPRAHYRFDLKSFPDIIDNVYSFIKCKKVTVASANSSYYLVNYDKKTMRKNNIDNEINYIKHFRSVVLNEDRKVIGFSPPMCEPRHVMNVIDFPNVQFAEEFVEGTMVNLFYNSANDVQDWVFSTKNTVSPVEKPAGKCFRSMFLEACANANLNFDDLPKEYAYSFVMQHPGNVIVAPVNTTALYIIAIYLIKNSDDFTNATAYEMERSEGRNAWHHWFPLWRIWTLDFHWRILWCYWLI